MFIKLKQAIPVQLCLRIKHRKGLEAMERAWREWVPGGDCRPQLSP